MLNFELICSQIENSEFSVPEQLDWIHLNNIPEKSLFYFCVYPYEITFGNRAAGIIENALAKQQKQQQ